VKLVKISSSLTMSMFGALKEVRHFPYVLSRSTQDSKGLQVVLPSKILSSIYLRTLTTGNHSSYLDGCLPRRRLTSECLWTVCCHPRSHLL
jgi:hypothetical protein